MVGAKSYLDVEVVTQASLHKKMRGLCHSTGLLTVSAEEVNPLLQPFIR